MKQETITPETEQMKRYLWHELGEAERDAIEERFFIDDHFFHALVELDDKLVESYARDNGALTPDERARLERSLKFVPERRAQVARIQVCPHPAPSRARQPGRVAAYLRALVSPPGYGYAWAGGLALLLLGVGYLLYDARQTRRYVAGLRQQQAAQQAQVEEMQRNQARPTPPADEAPRHTPPPPERPERVKIRRPAPVQPAPHPPSTALPPYQAKAKKVTPVERPTEQRVAAVLEPSGADFGTPVFTTRGGNTNPRPPVSVALPAQAAQVVVQLNLPPKAASGGPFTVQLNGQSLASRRVKASGLGRLRVTLDQKDLHTDQTNTLAVRNQAQETVGSYEFQLHKEER